MKSISLKRHHFPADVIREEVWRYFRLSLSLRDVEELMGHRGADYGALEQTVTFREIAPGRKAGWAGVTASHRHR